MKQSTTFLNMMLDDDTKKAFYGTQRKLPRVDEETKVMFSKTYSLKRNSGSNLKVSITIVVREFDEYFMKVKCNGKTLTKESKIYTNLVCLVQDRRDIESLAIDCIMS